MALSPSLFLHNFFWNVHTILHQNAAGFFRDAQCNRERTNDYGTGKVEICGVNTAKLPLLNSTEKEVLFARISQGDHAAREQYIEGNLRLVLSVIKRFSQSNENVDDLFQIGCIGLIKAIDNFDSTLNVKFSTYAVPMIQGKYAVFFGTTTR